MSSLKVTSSVGFSLIEILVTIVIVSVGLLAYAGLQIRGLSQTHSAFFRAQAAISANDMAERIRANLPGAQLGGYITTQTASLAKPVCTGGCSPFNLGVNDLKTWQVLLAQSLPLATGAVSCADSDLSDANPCSVNSTHTIIISWDDNRDGNADVKTQLGVRP